MIIAASLATIPSRGASRIRTVSSIKDQVSNWYVTSGIEPPKDACKFTPYTTKKADVWFFCDDDLIYPPDYVETSLKHLEKYPNAVLSYHGRRMNKKPIDSYYDPKNRKQAYRCLSTVEGYHEIINGTLGTGVMFFKSGTLNISMSDFKESNMADIWIAKLAKEQGKQMIVCPHKEGWIKYQEQPQGSTIFDQHFFKDEIQTRIFNSF